MAMNLEQHILNLDRMCRLCGKRVQKREFNTKGYKAKLCTTYAEKIKTTFGVNVQNDHIQQHPKHICHTCYCKLFCEKQWESVTWISHPRTGQCRVCEQWKQQAKGGGQTKRKYNYPPAHNSPQKYLDACIPGPAVPHIDTNKFHFTVSDELKCGLCTQLANKALESPCHHLFCLNCLKEEQTAERETYYCPRCAKTYLFSEVSSPREFLQGVMSSVPVTCKLCSSNICLEGTKEHMCEPSILQRPLEAPLTPIMEAVGSHILKSKLRQSNDGTTASFKTGGQPIQVMHIPKPRIDSTEAVTTTLAKRCQRLAKARALLSKDCSGAQLVHEVKRLPKEDLQSTLEQLNLSRVTIPKGDFLTVKAEICTTWKKARELKRWLKKYGIFAESEGSLRSQQDEIINNNISAKWVPLLHKDDDEGTIIKTTPLVSVQSLSEKVFQQLNGLDRLKLLCWNHNMPTDEVWIKIGGDKGGGNFKQVFQVANVEHPNSPQNTVVVTIFPADDTMANLKIGLQQHCEQLLELPKMMWKEKKLRIFIFGDYEYLCRVHGLTGASGRHCCLWCTIRKDEMRQPLEQRGPKPPRTLESVKEDLKRFREDGARPSAAKDFNNVIDDSLFAVPLDQVSPPGLHISLGLYLKHFNSFENACHLLDLKIAKQLDKTPPRSTPQFTEVIQIFSKARKMDEEAESLDDGANLLMEHLATVQDPGQAVVYHQTIQQHLTERNKLHQEATKLREAINLPKEKGPLVKQLDEILQTFQVARQAYHGKSFVGNHVHRCCKKENIEKLMNAVVDATQSLCPGLAHDAKEMTAKYSTLFRLFGTCHKQYNTAGLLTDDNTEALDATIKAYLGFFRANFPNETVPPKMHILEDHVMPFIRKWNVGLGFLGEQGVESVHARLNTIKYNIRGLKDELSILKSTIISHWVQTRPGAHST